MSAPALAAPAGGSGESAADLPFRIATAAGAFTVEHWVAPKALVAPLSGRLCRVRVGWRNGAIEFNGPYCDRQLQAVVKQALSKWVVLPPHGLTGDHNLGEVWFVFPHREGLEVTVLVKQSPDLRLTLPEGVDPAPFGIFAWTFLDFPDEMANAQGPSTCTVHVTADFEGFASEVQVEGCADAYQNAITSAVKQWRFVPAEVDGEPLMTSFTFQTTYEPSDNPSAATQSDPDAPTEARQHLWDTRQFDALTREERRWFIGQSLAPRKTRGERGPGRVRVRLPSAPEVGDRLPLGASPATLGTPPAPPDTPPLFTLRRDGHAAVNVYAAPLPTAAATPDPVGASCSMVLKLDGQGRIRPWAEQCEDSVRALSVDAARRWAARHDGNVNRSEQIRFTIRFPPGQEPYLLVDPIELADTGPNQRPSWLHTFQSAIPVKRIPPRLRRDLLEDGLPSGNCRLAITVSPRGRSEDLRVLSCPAGFERAVIKSIRKWRWRPAREDGSVVPFPTEVSVRFAP